MRAVDRWLLGVLAPIWVLGLLLSVASIGHDEVVAPLRVVGAEGASSLPVVTRLPVWTVENRENGLRVGDALLSVGGVDVQGASSVKVIGLAWAGMDSAGVLPAEVVRGGERLQVVAAIPATIQKWPTLLTSFVYGVIAIAGLMRFPTLRVSQVAFPALMASAIWMGSLFGETASELLGAFFLRATCLLFLQPLAVRLVRHFPEGDDRSSAWARGWPALFGLNGVILVDETLFGVLPPLISALAGQLITVGAAALTIAVGLNQYRLASRIGRQRFKWLLLGAVVASTPGSTVALMSIFRPELGAWFLPSQAAQLAVPVALFVAIGRHQLFDIDRLLNVTAVVAFFGGLFVAASIVGGPGASANLAEATGASQRTAALVLGFVALLFIVPVAVFIRRRLDAWVFHAVRLREAAVYELLPQISRASKLREVGDLLTERLPEIWRSRGAAVLVNVEDGLVPVAQRGDASAARDIAFGSPGERALLGASGAVPGEELGLQPGHLLAAVRTAEPGSPLAGALVLAPTRSGDAYEKADRSALALIAERVAGVVTALEQRERLAQARVLNAELGEQRDRAERASEEKSQLLATASHDLRQPLQALRLFLGTLEERIEDADLRGLVDKAQLSAIAMQQMFEALLDQTRLDAGALEPRLEAVSLDDAFGELSSFLEPLAASKGLTLSADGAGLAVRSDRSLLRSILQNLVANAVRYTDEGGIALRVRRDGEDVVIDVSDTGRGIAAEEQAQLFQAWRRGTTAHGEETGVGLGLSIVSRLVELLGHELSLSSESGAGSTFTLRAVAAIAEPAPAALAATPADGPLAGSVVFVIDDDAAARDALTTTLEGWGVEVVAGESAAAVTAAAGARVPEAVLLDYGLEQGTGLDALDALEATYGRLPAAVVSGETAAESVGAVRERGLAFLRKPAAAVQLRAMLSSLLARRSC